MELILARVDNKGIRDGMGSKFSLLGAGATMLAKDLEGTSLFCSIALALMYSISLLSYRTFISVY